MESALYGIYTLVVFVSEILVVRCAHSFDFWYVNNSCVNTVRQHFPWSILCILYTQNPWSALKGIKGWEMTLMVDVPRLWLHAYVRVCSTELQLQPCAKFFNSFKYGFFRQVVVLITVLIPFNKITKSGSWQPKLWITKITSIWILTGKDRV